MSCPRRLPKAFCLIKRRSLCQRNVSEALCTFLCTCPPSSLLLSLPRPILYPALGKVTQSVSHSVSHSASRAIVEIDYVCFNLANVINMFMGFNPHPSPPSCSSPLSPNNLLFSTSHLLLFKLRQYVLLTWFSSLSPSNVIIWE